MAVINPHTTRATGTVLTAAIYNADHQNHITNANNLNAELGTIIGLGASTGIIVSNGAGVVSGRTLQNIANQTVITNANGLAGDPTIGIATNPTLPGNVTIGGSLTASGGIVTMSPVGADVILSPTTTGKVTINPATVGTIDKMNIGVTVQGSVRGTTLQSNGTLVVGGVSTLAALNAALTTSTSGFRAPTGSAAVPTFAFTGNSTTGFYADEANKVKVATDGIYRALFSTTGFIVTAPAQVSELAAVVGWSVGYDGRTGCVVSNDSCMGLRRLGGNGGVIQTFVDGVANPCGTIVTSLNATAYNVASDGKLKINRRPIKRSGWIIDNLEPIKFDWINGDKSGYGVIAQHAKKIYPHAISQDDHGLYQADYSKFVPVLLAEVKKLRARVKQLELPIAA